MHDGVVGTRDEGQEGSGEMWQALRACCLCRMCVRASISRVVCACLCVYERERERKCGHIPLKCSARRRNEEKPAEPQNVSRAYSVVRRRRSVVVGTKRQ